MIKMMLLFFIIIKKNVNKQLFLFKTKHKLTYKS